MIKKAVSVVLSLAIVLCITPLGVLPVGATSSSAGAVVGGVGKKLTSADVAHVEVAPIEIIENTYGDWQVHVDGDTGELIDYYCYNWSAFISYTITLKNGDVIEAPDGYFTYDGVHYPLVYFHAHQTYNERWLVGNTYTIKHTILGEEYEFPVTIVESPVLSIRCDTEEIVIREGTYCDLLPDSTSDLYQYRWYEAANWIITYTNGKQETTYDRIVEIDGHNYAFEFTDAQATLQNWTAGNTYTGHAEFLGAKCDVDVRITDSFIRDIQFEPIYVYENADGMLNTQYDHELDQDREYFRYNWRQFLAYTATLFDGTVIEGTGDCLCYDNEWYWFETADTQSLYTPWLAGHTYPVEIAVLGETYTTGVQVVPNPVMDIQFPNIVIPQGLYGETVEEYDALLNQVFTVFQYDVAKFFDYIVSFDDGTTAEATYNGFRYDNRSYGARMVGGAQNHNNVWEPGKTYHITVNIMGVELVVLVYIQPIPEAEGFGYIRNYDGTVSITEYSKTDERLIIPSTIGEYTVTEIQSVDIADEYITEIVIPKSVRSLSWCDFTAFDKLTTIYYEGSENDWRDISHCYTGYDGLTIVYNHVIDSPAEPGKDLLYEISGGEVTITGYSGEGGDVTLPSTIGGYPVTSIGGWAFRDCSSLTSITIPDGVTSVGSFAFEDCSSLTTITIPDSVTSIGSWAFSGCSSLTTITIPDSVTSIGECAFYGCDSLTSITIPDGVTSIGYSAFCWCSSLASITLPDGVTSIGGYAFEGCSSLTTITIPDSVTSIGGCAFKHCRSLTSITIPDSVTSIEDDMFWGCSSLTSITIPDSVTSIGNEAFSYCTNLAHVWYGGTEADKAAMSIGDWNEDLLNATWHYADEPNNPSEPDEPVIDENAPQFVVEDVTAKAGDTVTVAVKVKNNPGIVSAKLNIGYDANVLELISGEWQDFTDGVSGFGPTTVNPFVVNWANTLSGNNTTDGVLALLTFKVKDGAVVGDTVITVSYDPDDVYDENWDNVSFATVDGTVNIIEYISGDVNDDGKVNNKDLGLLLQHLNGWTVDVVELACDVTRDGKVNNKDLGILLQYLNGWPVELK